MLVEIYTKEDCPYCQLAKTALASKNIQFTEQKLYKDFTREHILEKFPTAKTFPIIVLDGFYIGGYNQLREYLEEQSRSNQTLLNE
jgi:glutaredoxin